MGNQISANSCGKEERRVGDQDEGPGDALVSELLSDRTEGLAVRKPMGRAISADGGCATCPHSVKRFNNGNGATTCGKLDHLIVSYGHKVPEHRPDNCPLDGDPDEIPF